MTSTPRRLRLASQACTTYSGRPSIPCLPSAPFVWPNLVARMTLSRRPLSARPSSCSLWPQPYISEESRWLMPRSSAWWMTEIDSSSLALPYTPDMDMQPSPMAVTSMEVRPSFRFSMLAPLCSKKVEIFALLPVADLEVEARHLGLLDAAVVVDELATEALVQHPVRSQMRERLGERARQKVG